MTFLTHFIVLIYQFRCFSIMTDQSSFIKNQFFCSLFNFMCFFMAIFSFHMFHHGIYVFLLFLVVFSDGGYMVKWWSLGTPKTGQWRNPNKKFGAQVDPNRHGLNKWHYFLSSAMRFLFNLDFSNFPVHFRHQHAVHVHCNLHDLDHL